MIDCVNCGGPVHAEAVGCPACGADPATGIVPESVQYACATPSSGRGGPIVDLFGIGRIGGVNPITGLPTLRVAPADVDDARKMLAELTSDAGETDAPEPKL